MKTDKVALLCKRCNEEFLVDYYKRKIRKFCSKHCSTKYIYETKDNSERHKKVSEALKYRYKTDLDPSFLGKSHTEETKNKTRQTRKERGLDKSENNPMFGQKHSKEAREKISKTRSENIVKGNYSGWFKKGDYFSVKLNREIPYQSSWELEFFKYLDADSLVLVYDPQPLKISYKYEERKRNYIPDLLVTYISGERKLIEIKPDYYIEAKINKAKFKSAQKYCKERGMLFEVWTEKENPYFEEFK